MIRTLTLADIPAAMRLNQAAGWNQTSQDWGNLIRLAPEGCFGIERDGLLVATTTAVCYGQRLAWIGMVLTDPLYRGRGFARRLMEHALAFLKARDIDWIKLDATEMGRPLYRKLGFEDECAIERWGGAGFLLPTETQITRKATVCPALDLEAFGADRGELLSVLANIDSGDIDDAYAMGRPGANAAYFGPCVSRSASAARDLLCWFLSRHRDESVFWDVLPGNAGAVSLAHEFGFRPVRRLTRMTRRGRSDALPLKHNDGYVFAIAGFEYG